MYEPKIIASCSDKIMNREEEQSTSCTSTIRQMIFTKPTLKNAKGILSNMGERYLKWVLKGVKSEEEDLFSKSSKYIHEIHNFLQDKKTELNENKENLQYNTQLGNLKLIDELIESAQNVISASESCSAKIKGNKEHEQNSSFVDIFGSRPSSPKAQDSSTKSILKSAKPVEKKTLSFAAKATNIYQNSQTSEISVAKSSSSERSKTKEGEASKPQEEGSESVIESSYPIEPQPLFAKLKRRRTRNSKKKSKVEQVKKSNSNEKFQFSGSDFVEENLERDLWEFPPNLGEKDTNPVNKFSFFSSPIENKSFSSIPNFTITLSPSPKKFVGETSKGEIEGGMQSQKSHHSEFLSDSLFLSEEHLVENSQNLATLDFQETLDAVFGDDRSKTFLDLSQNTHKIISQGCGSSSQRAIFDETDNHGITTGNQSLVDGTGELSVVEASVECNDFAMDYFGTQQRGSHSTRNNKNFDRDAGFSPNVIARNAALRDPQKQKGGDFESPSYYSAPHGILVNPMGESSKAELSSKQEGRLPESQKTEHKISHTSGESFQHSGQIMSATQRKGDIIQEISSSQKYFTKNNSVIHVQRNAEDADPPKSNCDRTKLIGSGSAYSIQSELIADSHKSQDEKQRLFANVRIDSCLPRKDYLNCAITSSIDTANYPSYGIIPKESLLADQAIGTQQEIPLSQIYLLKNNSANNVQKFRNADDAEPSKSHYGKKDLTGSAYSVQSELIAESHKSEDERQQLRENMLIAPCVPRNDHPSCGITSSTDTANHPDYRNIANENLLADQAEGSAEPMKITNDFDVNNLQRRTMANMTQQEVFSPRYSPRNEGLIALQFNEERNVGNFLYYGGAYQPAGASVECGKAVGVGDTSTGIGAIPELVGEKNLQSQNHAGKTVDDLTDNSVLPASWYVSDSNAANQFKKYNSCNSQQEVLSQRYSPRKEGLSGLQVNENGNIEDLPRDGGAYQPAGSSVESGKAVEAGNTSTGNGKLPELVSENYLQGQNHVGKTMDDLTDHSVLPEAGNVSDSNATYQFTAYNTCNSQQWQHSSRSSLTGVTQATDTVEANREQERHYANTVSKQCVQMSDAQEAQKLIPGNNLKPGDIDVSSRAYTSEKIRNVASVHKTLHPSQDNYSKLYAYGENYQGIPKQNVLLELGGEQLMRPPHYPPQTDLTINTPQELTGKWSSNAVATHSTFTHHQPENACHQHFTADGTAQNQALKDVVYLSQLGFQNSTNFQSSQGGNRTGANTFGQQVVQYQSDFQNSLRGESGWIGKPRIIIEANNTSCCQHSTSHENCSEIRQIPNLGFICYPIYTSRAAQLRPDQVEPTLPVCAMLGPNGSMASVVLHPIRPCSRESLPLKQNILDDKKLSQPCGMNCNDKVDVPADQNSSVVTGALSHKSSSKYMDGTEVIEFSADNSIKKQNSVSGLLDRPITAEFVAEKITKKCDALLKHINDRPTNPSTQDTDQFSGANIGVSHESSAVLNYQTEHGHNDEPKTVESVAEDSKMKHSVMAGNGTDAPAIPTKPSSRQAKEKPNVSSISKTPRLLKPLAGQISVERTIVDLVDKSKSNTSSIIKEQTSIRTTHNLVFSLHCEEPKVSANQCSEMYQRKKSGFPTEDSIHKRDVSELKHLTTSPTAMVMPGTEFVGIHITPVSAEHNPKSMISSINSRIGTGNTDHSENSELYQTGSELLGAPKTSKFSAENIIKKHSSYESIAMTKQTRDKPGLSQLSSRNNSIGTQPNLGSMDEQHTESPSHNHVGKSHVPRGGLQRLETCNAPQDNAVQRDLNPSVKSSEKPMSQPLNNAGSKLKNSSILSKQHDAPKLPRVVKKAATKPKRELLAYHKVAINNTQSSLAQVKPTFVNLNHTKHNSVNTAKANPVNNIHSVMELTKTKNVAPISGCLPKSPPTHQVTDKSGLDRSDFDTWEAFDFEAQDSLDGCNALESGNAGSIQDLSTKQRKNDGQLLIGTTERVENECKTIFRQKPSHLSLTKFYGQQGTELTCDVTAQRVTTEPHRQLAGKVDCANSQKQHEKSTTQAHSSNKISKLPAIDNFTEYICENSTDNTPVDDINVDNLIENILKNIKYIRIPPDSELIEVADIDELYNEQMFKW